MKKFLSLLLASMLSFNGCATIFHGTKEHLTLNSEERETRLFEQ
ncbi:hypothetical protein AAIR98_001983 [Elusimicrobium simillimum]